MEISPLDRKPYTYLL